MTVLENVGVAAAARRLSGQAPEVAAWETIRELSLESIASRNGATLSYGERRRVEIARALAVRPRFLLLDEPAAGLNETEGSELLRSLALIRSDYELGILIVDHSLQLIMKLCDRVAVLNEGRLIALDVPGVVQRDPKVREAYFGRSRERLA